MIIIDWVYQLGQGHWWHVPLFLLQLYFTVWGWLVLYVGAKGIWMRLTKGQRPEFTPKIAVGSGIGIALFGWLIWDVDTTPFFTFYYPHFWSLLCLIGVLFHLHIMGKFLKLFFVGSISFDDIKVVFEVLEGLSEKDDGEKD